MALQVIKLSGGYFNQCLLKDLTFQVNKGEIIGLLGLNGAGKSTLFKALIKQLPHFDGQVKINQYSINENSENYLKQITYLPERPLFYPELTLWEHIELLKRLNDLPKASLEQAEYLLKEFRLENMKDRKPYYFSKGMQQKVMIIQTLLQDTPVLLLDEPFSGLDPLAVYTLRKHLLREKADGKIVILTTHLLHEAEQICDDYLWLKDGELIAYEVINKKCKEKNQPASLEELYLCLLEEGE